MLRIVRSIRVIPKDFILNSRIIHIYTFLDINTREQVSFNSTQTLGRMFKGDFKRNYDIFLRYFVNRETAFSLNFCGVDVKYFLRGDGTLSPCDPETYLKIWFVSSKRQGTNIKDIILKRKNVKVSWGGIETHSGLIEKEELLVTGISKDDILDLLSDPETTTDFNTYLEINLLKHYKLL